MKSKAEILNEVVQAAMNKAEKARMEAALSPAEHAAGIKVVEKDGKLYYDYTDVINKRLEAVLSEFQARRINYLGADELTLYGFVKALYDHSAGMVLNPISGTTNDYGNLIWFATQVGIGCPWDVKRVDPWQTQFGDLRMPTFWGDNAHPELDEIILYRGVEMTRETLGNVTYGYLGSAMNISETMLFMAGGAVEVVSAEDHLSQLWRFLIDDQHFGEPLKDHISVQFGVNAYHEDQAK